MICEKSYRINEYLVKMPKKVRRNVAKACILERI